MNLLMLIDGFNYKHSWQAVVQIFKTAVLVQRLFGQYLMASAELLYFGGVRTIEVTKDDTNHGFPEMKFMGWNK